jgi:acetate kinase
MPLAAPETSDQLVLVINAGSSSLKAALISPEGRPLWRDQRPCDGEGALEALLEQWLRPSLAPWRNAIRLVAHRVVHGGERFAAPTRLGPSEIEAIAALVPLAPLHNAPVLAAIRWFACHEPAWPQAACFDTAFHRSLPEAAATYAIPTAWRDQGLRRYGFHGLNHQHISEVVAERFAGMSPLRLISCHLGAGCSLCAIRDGVSIDTTMGFTPLEGLVMASRSGSLDPGLLLHLMRQGLSPEALDQALNHNSGLLGLSGLSGSMQTLRLAASEGHHGAQLAIAVFRHRLLQAIGAMAASLGGLDVIALSGGIGEHDTLLAEELDAALGWLRPFALVVIPADEEGLLARHCWPLA